MEGSGYDRQLGTIRAVGAQRLGHLLDRLGYVSAPEKHAALTRGSDVAGLTSTVGGQGREFRAVSTR